MTNPRPKTPRDIDSTEEKDQVTNPNRRQDEMNEESQRGAQRTRDKNYGSSESKPTDRQDEQGGRKQNDPQGGGKQNDPYRKH